MKKGLLFLADIQKVSRLLAKGYSPAEVCEETGFPEEYFVYLLRCITGEGGDYTYWCDIVRY